MQEHLNQFQKILTDLLSVGEKVEKKTQALVLLELLPPLYESLVTALLIKKSTIKMDEVTVMILQNKIIRRENSASNLDGGSSTLTILEEQVATNEVVKDHEEDDSSSR